VIKLVIFDMDGVLVDACEWHRIALNEALQEICNYEISLEEHYNEFNGLPTRIKLNKLKEKNIIQSTCFEEIEKLKQQKTIDIINKMAFLRQEKIEMINFLKNKGMKIGCYTNSIRMTAKLMLEKTGVLDMLDCLVTNQDVKHPKPSPEGYLTCMSLLGCAPENTIIVEDSPKGLESARATGARIFEVKNPNEVTIKLFEEIK
jgi:beta-phosphoglucomutase